MDGHLLETVSLISIFGFVIIALCLFQWFMYLSALVHCKRILHKKVKDVTDRNSLPGVSIAKPICAASSDPNLVENLSSFFHLDYPQYEIFFCIEDSEDVKLIKIVNDLIAKYPAIDAHLCVGARDLVTNPKVSNMTQAYDKAKYPLFWISDARIKTKADTLIDLVGHMTTRVGLVHQIPLVADGDLSFGRQVEQIYFGGSHSRVYMAANLYGFNCMTGMSCLFRKNILDEDGGLHRLGRYLGEDFFLAQTILNKGWKLALGTQPAIQNCGITSVRFFQARMIRWMYVRTTQMPQLIILEPLYENIVLGPLLTLSLYYMYSVQPYICLPVYFLCWVLADYILISAMQNKRPAYSFHHYVKCWMYRELAFLYMFGTALTSRTIIWAGKKFIVHYGGLAERIPQNGVSHA